MPRSTIRSAPQLLSTSEAAQLLSVSSRTITNWINDDLIPYVTLPGGTHRIPQQALLRSLGGNYKLAEEVQVAQEDERSEAESRAELRPSAPA